MWGGCVPAKGYVWRSEDTLQGSVLSSRCVRLRGWIQLVQLSCRCLFPLSHLASPLPVLSIN